MAIVVEDGTGKVDGETYISVADADTYHAARNTAVAWAAVPDVATKEAHLRDATIYLDSHYEARFGGRRANELQALACPRAKWLTRSDRFVDSATIPPQIQNATAELAHQRISGPLMAVASTATGTAQVDEVVAGPVKVKFAKRSYSRLPHSYPSAQHLVKHLLVVGGRSPRI